MLDWRTVQITGVTAKINAIIPDLSTINRRIKIPRKISTLIDKKTPEHCRLCQFAED